MMTAYNILYPASAHLELAIRIYSLRHLQAEAAPYFRQLFYKEHSTWVGGQGSMQLLDSQSVGLCSKRIDLIT